MPHKKDFRCYPSRGNPATNIWTQKASLPGLGKSGATCFVIGDTVYIFGGQSVQSDAIDEV